MLIILKNWTINKKRIFPSAFTLVEMMTSIFIIVMITGIFTANYKTSNKRTDLVMTAQKMVADIRGAQNNALGLVQYSDYFPRGGWAMNFDLSGDNESRYIMFGDLDAPAINDGWQEIPAEYGFGLFSDGEGDTDVGAKIVYLPRGIVIDSLETSANSSADLVNINFLPPDPITYVFDGVNQATWAKIVLKDIQNDTTKTVFVNFLGLVEVID